jgi:hypothetical protein
MHATGVMNRLPHLPWSRVSQEAGGLSEPHRFGAFCGPELLVDVLHVRLHGGTADAELSADRSERPIRGEERQDARLGRRQRNRRARRFRAAAIGLAGNGPRTIGRGSSLRHRPKWLVSRDNGAFARVDSVRGENPGEAVGGTTTESLSTSPTSRLGPHRNRSLAACSPAAEAGARRAWAGETPARHPVHPRKASPGFAGFPMVSSCF